MLIERPGILGAITLVVTFLASTGPAGLRAEVGPMTGPISPAHGQYANFTIKVWRGFLVESSGWLSVSYASSNLPYPGINVTITSAPEGIISDISWQLVNTTDRMVSNSSTGVPVTPFYYWLWVPLGLSVGQQILFVDSYRNVTSTQSLSLSFIGPYSPVSVNAWVVGAATVDQSATQYWFDQKSGHLVKYHAIGSRTTTIGTLSKTNIAIGDPPIPPKEKPETPWYAAPVILGTAGGITLTGVLLFKKLRMTIKRVRPPNMGETA